MGQNESEKFEIFFYPFRTVKRFAFHHGLFSRDHRTDKISALSDMIRNFNFFTVALHWIKNIEILHFKQ